MSRRSNAGQLATARAEVKRLRLMVREALRAASEAFTSADVHAALVGQVAGEFVEVGALALVGDIGRERAVQALRTLADMLADDQIKADPL